MKAQWTAFHAYTLTPTQTARPSPANPCLQVQLNEPLLLVQSTFWLHGLGFREHSSKSDAMEIEIID